MSVLNENEETHMEKHTFTFGSDHLDVNGNSLGKAYVVIEGDLESSRETMFSLRGRDWAFQYRSPEEAGAERWNLREVPIEQIALYNTDTV